MKNHSLLIEGSSGDLALNGEISVGGAKNAALKVMAASILFKDQIKLTNVPEIEDVKQIARLLESIGIKVRSDEKNTRTITPGEKVSGDMASELASTTRSAIVLTGPLLSRCGSISFPNPGGCDLGARPIDLFLEGFEKFGATINSKDGKYFMNSPKGGLKGTEFFFRVQSHTGTETLMMTAVLAKGKTILKNCALEPEVVSLAEFLVSCGAKIKGAGTPTIEIEGGELLEANGKIYKTIPDRIETASFMILGALAAKELIIKNCLPEHVEMTTAILRRAGARVETLENSITVFGEKNLKALNVRTHEFPGLPTDVQAQMAVFLTQCEGESTLFETIYEGRLGYIPSLISMGADIIIQDSHRVKIKGKTKLKAVHLRAPDLRAGFGFVVAGLIAEGVTEIENAYAIDRGYESIESRFTKLGASIKRK